MIALDNIQPEEKNEKADDKQENKESVDKNTLAQQAKDKHESMVKDFAQGIHNYTDQKTGKIFEVKIENNDMVLGVLDHGNKEILFTSKIDNL